MDYTLLARLTQSISRINSISRRTAANPNKLSCSLADNLNAFELLIPAENRLKQRDLEFLEEMKKLEEKHKKHTFTYVALMQKTRHSLSSLKRMLGRLKSSKQPNKQQRQSSV